MARYLLDTTGLVDISKAREPARSRIRAMIAAGDQLGVCAVSVSEFVAGLHPEQRPEWLAYLDGFHFWETSREAATLAGLFRYRYARLGRALSTPDALVAAVAATIGAIVLTDNIKDYPMPEVVVRSLRA